MLTRPADYGNIYYENSEDKIRCGAAPDREGNPMLKLENISFDVTEDAATKGIVKDISLDIGDKSFMVITGPNGGGKSTLAKLIAGIEKPTGGRILLDGVDITGMDITQRAKAGIGYAFQQPVRFKGLTVKDLITLAAGRALSTEDACHYLSEVGLCAIEYIDREVNGSLSGGELKRIEIASVIARGARISVFDEPEAGIDLWSFHNLIRVFEHMRKTTAGTVIIISHQERILETADKIVVLAGGRITGMGSREEILPGLLGGADTCRFYKGERT